MARQDKRRYDYEYDYHSEHKQRHHRNPRLRVLDHILLFLVIPVPLIGLVMYLIGINLPVLWLSGYAAVALTVAGLLFLILTTCHVGGFGKVGYFFSHTRGKRWMTPEEAKGNTYLFGFIMLVIGVMSALIFLKNCGILL